MKKSFLFIAFISVSFLACSQKSSANLPVSTSVEPKKEIDTTLSLKDFYSENDFLDKKVERIFNQLDDTLKVAQLIMPAMGRLGQSTPTIFRLVRQRKIGGILMLNGTTTQFKNWIDSINAINLELGVPAFLYSADAEPSLVNRKIAGTQPVKKANELENMDEVKACALSIANDLKAIGINYDFAPVVDMSPNAVVGYRSFGKKPEHIVPWSNAFIATLQENGIIATAKHFPGHGLVSGDSHKSLQTIDGELKEIKNYPPLIENNVLSIMIGHLAVVNNTKYNTNELPATVSRTIVTDLLRKEMDFKGLIVTDAMNMGGVVRVPDCEQKAIAAGCDIALMPVNTDKAFDDIFKNYQKDTSFQKTVDESVKRILRMKLCLGIIK